MTSQHGHNSQMLTLSPIDTDVIDSGGEALRYEWNVPPSPAAPTLLGDIACSIPVRSDQYLVDAARSGSQTAFNELWNLYSGRLYRSALKIMKNRDDAEDAVQDAFLRAFLAIDRFEGRSSVYVWLTRIAINSALAILRKRRRKPESSLDSMTGQGCYLRAEHLRDLTPGPEQVFDRQQRHAILAQAMSNLPARLRAVVHTLVVEDCSMKEVAHLLNISEVAAKSRLYRARAIMNTHLLPPRVSALNTRKSV